MGANKYGITYKQSSSFSFTYYVASNFVIVPKVMNLRWWVYVPLSRCFLAVLYLVM